jgi:hypothetical protein
MYKIVDILLYLVLFFSTAFAQETDALPYTFEYTPSVIVSGILTILIGLLMLFFGYRMLKFMLFFAGFYVFAIIGFTVLTKTNAGGGNPNVLLWGSLAIGIVGGILALLIYRFGIALLGALGGMTIAIWIQSLKAGGVLTDQTQITIFILVFALIGAIVIQFAEKPIIIIASSFTGSFSICYGIDTFTHLGYSGRFRDAFNEGINNAQLDIQSQEIGWQFAALLAANLVLFIIGCWYQFQSNRGRNHKDKEDSSA